MTIPASVSEISYQGNGVSKTFAVPFAFDVAGDLRVILRDSDGNESSVSYTTTGGNGSTGTVVLPTAPAVGTTLVIYDDPEVSQQVDYLSNDGFPAETHEHALDKLTRIAKRTRKMIGRALRVPDGENDPGTIPPLEQRIGMYLAFGPDGNPVPASGTGADAGLRADLASSAPGLGVDLVHNAAKASELARTVLRVANRAELAALVPPPSPRTVYVEGYTIPGDGGGGVATWHAGDYSANIAADPFGGVYVAPADAPTGAAGCWKFEWGTAVDVRAFGVSPDSPADQTARCVSAAAVAASEGLWLVWPAGVFWVDATAEVAPWHRGLVVPSGSQWQLSPGTVIRALPTSAGNYEVLSIHDASDVRILGRGALILGERSAHTGVTGEWGNGVSIRGATRVYIEDLRVEDCWGDGWYIGATPLQEFSEDITLVRIAGTGNRRQGLSLVSAKNFWCYDGVFALTNGTSPQAGVDIEPNANSEFLTNINFIRTQTYGNAGAGFKIYLNSMGGSANLVSIRVVDHLDDGSLNGFDAKYPATVPLAGSIHVIRPLWVRSQAAGANIEAYNSTGPLLLLDHPVVEDFNRGGFSGQAFTSAIAIHGVPGNSSSGSLGNIEVRAARVHLRSGSANNSILVNDLRPNASPVAGVRILEPLALAGLRMFIGEGVAGGNQVDIRDPLNTSSRTLVDASQNITGGATYSLNIVPQLASTRSLTLAANLAIGTELEFYITGGGSAARLIFPGGQTLVPGGLGPNNWLQSANTGARLRIKKVDSATWCILKQLGTWTLSS